MVVHFILGKLDQILSTHHISSMSEEIKIIAVYKLSMSNSVVFLGFDGFVKFLNFNFLHFICFIWHTPKIQHDQNQTKETLQHAYRKEGVQYKVQESWSFSWVDGFVEILELQILVFFILQLTDSQNSAWSRPNKATLQDV